RRPFRQQPRRRTIGTAPRGRRRNACSPDRSGSSQWLKVCGDCTGAEHKPKLYRPALPPAKQGAFVAPVRETRARRTHACPQCRVNKRVRRRNSPGFLPRCAPAAPSVTTTWRDGRWLAGAGEASPRGRGERRLPRATASAAAGAPAPACAAPACASSAGRRRPRPPRWRRGLRAGASATVDALDAGTAVATPSAEIGTLSGSARAASGSAAPLARLRAGRAPAAGLVSLRTCGLRRGPPAAPRRGGCPACVATTSPNEALSAATLATYSGS